MRGLTIYPARAQLLCSNGASPQGFWQVVALCAPQRGLCCFGGYRQSRTLSPKCYTRNPALGFAGLQEPPGSKAL